MKAVIVGWASLVLASKGSVGTDARKSSRRSLPLQLLRLSLAVGLASWPGCGGGGGGGPADSEQPLPLASGLDFTITPMVNNATVVEFWWSGAASEYRLEIGSSPGASDVATFDTSASAFTWTGVPIGNFRARVRARQGTRVGAASNEVLVGSIDARQMIDALIFGHGPLAVAGNPAGPTVPDQMSGWQPGTQFRVILGESVSSSFATAAENTAGQIGRATQGAVQATMVGRQPDPLPTPGPDEVTISTATQQDIDSACQCDNCIGCTTRWVRGSFIHRARLQTSSTAPQSGVANQMGFAIGLAHIISPSGVRPPFTTGVTTDGRYLPSGQVIGLDPATIRMLQTLYGAGLTAGSTRQQFEAAGFIPSESAGIAPSAASSRRPPAYFVTREGDETVVTERLYPERSVSH